MGAVQREVDRDGEGVTGEQVRQSQVSYQEALHMTQSTLRMGPAESEKRLGEKGEEGVRARLVVAIEDYTKYGSTM